MKKIIAIVPAYNEEANLQRVIEDIRGNRPDVDILIVNDCSSDDTESVARGLIVKVLSLPVNLGIGGAVQTGLKYACNNGYDIALQFDGDGQHVGSEIAKLIDIIENDEADVAIGSRFLGRGDFKSTFSRRIGIAIISLINSILTGSRITDNTSGFRAYNARAIAFLAEHYPQDYPEPVAVVELYRNGFRIKEIATEMRDREAGVSSIGPFGSVEYMVKVVIANIIAFSRKPSKKEVG